AAETGNRVGFAQAGSEAATNLDQQLIASCVSQTVVDHFEAIQVDEQHRQLLAVALRAGEAVGDAVEEQSTVWQTRQRVVEGAVTKLFFEYFTLGGATK